MLSIPSWSIICMFVTLHMHLLSTLPLFAAGLEVFPLWNDTRNITHHCFIDNSTAEQGFITFHGSPYLTCSLQVTSSQYVLIEITGGFTGDGFFFIDQANKCKERYLTWYRESQSCNVTISAENFQLNVLANISVVLTEDESAHVVDCGSVYKPNGTFQSSCEHVQRYNKAYECETDQEAAGLCRFNFPSNCNASLSKHETLLQCEESGQTKLENILLIYQADITQLYVRSNNIHSIANHTFSNLKYLKWLFVDNNKLKELLPGVFRGLTKLELLHLAHNKLTALPASLLKGLTSLRNLQLQGNKLVTLDGSFFQSLKSLFTVQLDQNKLTSLPDTIFRGLENLKYVWISNNQQFEMLPNTLFQDAKNLIWIHMYKNNFSQLPVDILQGQMKVNTITIDFNPLQSLVNGTFHGLGTLEKLGLQKTMLKHLPVGIFDGLVNLKGLSLSNSSFVSFDSQVFRGLYNLQRLALHFNQLKELPAKLFHNLQNLTLLRLNGNELSFLAPDQFDGLQHLSFLDISHNNFVAIPISSHVIGHLSIFAISHNPFKEVDQKSLSGLSNGTQLLVSQNELCECYSPQNVKCSAEDDRSPFLMCDRLLSDKFLVVVMWLIGLLSLVGNLFVIIWKQNDSSGNKVQSVLLTNLAISDFLMGVYMIIIGIADIYYGDPFPLYSEKWRSSAICRLAGTLCILSSEASVFFVTLIGIDRYININFPFSNRKFRTSSISKISVMAWLIAIVLAVIPNIFAGQNIKFYDNSHVCIGFPLALLESFSKIEIDLIDWEGVKFQFFSSYSVSNGFSNSFYYSTALFLGLNCLCYLVILFCYIAIIRAVRASSKRSRRSQDMNTQIKLTIKVTAIVATDFLCWFPIIILGILVQARAITLPPSVFAWIVTCVLPINSAVNPYLYTIAEVVSKQRKKLENLSMDTKNTSIISRKSLSSERF